MCDGVSILRVAIPQQLFEKYVLERLVRRRSQAADEELQFLFADWSLKAACLPVLHHGEIEIYEWGNRQNRVRRLPANGLCSIETIGKGLWRECNPEKVTVVANFALVNGVWFPVEHGIESLLVRDMANRPHVYLLTDQSTHYFKIMTGSNRSPVLVNQVI